MDRIALYSGPFNLAAGMSERQQKDKNNNCHQHLGFQPFPNRLTETCQSTRHHRNGQTDAKDTSDWGKSCQRTVCKGITGGKPRQTGENPASKPFEQCPESRKEHHQEKDATHLKTAFQKKGKKTGKGRQKPHKHGKQGNAGTGHQGIHPAINMQADKHPVKTCAKTGGAISPAAEKGMTFLRLTDHNPCQHCQTENLETPDPIRRKGKDRQDAGQESDNGKNKGAEAFHQ